MHPPTPWKYPSRGGGAYQRRVGWRIKLPARGGFKIYNPPDPSSLRGGGGRKQNFFLENWICSPYEGRKPQYCNGQVVGQPRKRECRQMSEKCRKNVRNIVQMGAVNTIFGHFLDKFCLFGRCFCLVTLSNARPLQPQYLWHGLRNCCHEIFPWAMHGSRREKCHEDFGVKSCCPSFLRKWGGS